jgi:hypothetical protein
VISLLPLKCEIELYDENGIDVTGTGPDEGLTMEIKGTLSRRNINHKFQFRDADFRLRLLVSRSILFLLVSTSSI